MLSCSADSAASEKRILFGDGGHQIGAKWHNQPCSISKDSKFYIENIFEELDSPGEWYYDKKQSILYYMPYEDLDLDNALIEVPLYKQVIQFKGSQKNPVQHIKIEGIRITHTKTTSYNINSYTE